MTFENDMKTDLLVTRYSNIKTHRQTYIVSNEMEFAEIRYSFTFS